MSAVSGINGYITLGSCTPLAITDASFTYGSPNEQYYAVSGDGAAETVETAKRGEGTFNAVIDDATGRLISSVIESGELVTFAFYAKSGGDAATGQCRIGQPEFSFNREGTPQRMNFPFMIHGKLTGTLIT